MYINAYNGSLPWWDDEFDSWAPDEHLQAPVNIRVDVMRTELKNTEVNANSALC